MADIVRKELYKKARVEGKTKADAMRAAGYAESTCTDRQGDTPSVVLGERELQEDIKKLITPEYVLSKLRQETENAQKASDRIAATALLGKYLQMFKEESKQGIAIFNNVNDLQQDIDALRNKRTVSEAVVGDKAGQIELSK